MRNRSIALLGSALLYAVVIVGLDVLALGTRAADRATRVPDVDLVRPQAIILAVGVAVVALSTIPVITRRPRAALWAGLAAGPYLIVLAVVALTLPYQLDPPGLGWYPAARIAVIALAGITHLAGVFAIPSPDEHPARPVVAALLAHTGWAGPVITVLGLIGISQARAISYEAARNGNPDLVGDPKMGDLFLEVATGSLWVYAAIFAAAAALLLALAWGARRLGAVSWVQAGAGLLAVPYLLLMLAASVATPFYFGDSDEDVNQVIVDGPGWYQPAVWATAAISLAGLIGGIRLLARRPRR